MFWPLKKTNINKCNVFSDTMQIIYTKPREEEWHFNDKAFSVAPKETVMLVKAEEETVNQMKKRSNFSTRAMNKYIAVVLYTNTYNNTIIDVPADICIEDLVEERTICSRSIHTWRTLRTLVTYHWLLLDSEKILLNLIRNNSNWGM